MSEFSKKHLMVIASIRDRIDEDPIFRQKYLNNEMLHSAVEWFCNDPDITEDPFEVWRVVMTWVSQRIATNTDKKFSYKQWRESVEEMLRPMIPGEEAYAGKALTKKDRDLERKNLGYTDEHDVVIDLIAHALVHNDGFRKLYNDNDDFHDKIEKYCRNPKIEKAGTDEDNHLRELTIDMIVAIMRPNNLVKRFKVLLKAIDAMGSTDGEEDWWI